MFQGSICVVSVTAYQAAPLCAFFILHKKNRVISFQQTSVDEDRSGNVERGGTDAFLFFKWPNVWQLIEKGKSYLSMLPLAKNKTRRHSICVCERPPQKSPHFGDTSVIYCFFGWRKGKRKKIIVPRITINNNDFCLFFNRNIYMCIVSNFPQLKDTRVWCF